MSRLEECSTAESPCTPDCVPGSVFIVGHGHPRAVHLPIDRWATGALTCSRLSRLPRTSARPGRGVGAAPQTAAGDGGTRAVQPSATVRSLASLRALPAAAETAPSGAVSTAAARAAAAAAARMQRGPICGPVLEAAAPWRAVGTHIWFPAARMQPGRQRLAVAVPSSERLAGERAAASAPALLSHPPRGQSSAASHIRLYLSCTRVQSSFLCPVASLTLSSGLWSCVVIARRHCRPENAAAFCANVAEGTRSQGVHGVVSITRTSSLCLARSRLCRRYTGRSQGGDGALDDDGAAAAAAAARAGAPEQHRLALDNPFYRCVHLASRREEDPA